MAGESALTGSDVITEVISSNRRIQGGMKMNAGGVSFSGRRGEEIPEAQNAIDELNDKFTKTHGDRYNV